MIGLHNLWWYKKIPSLNWHQFITLKRLTNRFPLINSLSSGLWQKAFNVGFGGLCLYKVPTESQTTSQSKETMQPSGRVPHKRVNSPMIGFCVVVCEEVLHVVAFSFAILGEVTSICFALRALGRVYVVWELRGGWLSVRGPRTCRLDRLNVVQCEPIQRDRLTVHHKYSALCRSTWHHRIGIP